MAKTDLTAERLRELLDYNPETGVFMWRRAHQRIRVGDTAGTTDTHGYIQIQIFGRLHLAHRLAWIYAKGCLSGKHIDHMNGIRSDNRIQNLRLVSGTENAQNRKTASSSNLSGFLGVSHRGPKWQAQINAAGVKHYLGVFDTPELAHAAYIAAKRKLHSTCTI